MKNFLSVLKSMGFLLAWFFVLSSLPVLSQVEIDNAIHLTGGDGSREINGLETPVEGTDAVNKDYVDAAISSALSGGSFTFSATPEFSSVNFLDMPAYTLRHSIELKRLTGTPGVVTLSASGFPAGISWDFFSGGGYVSYESDLEMVQVSPITAGTYTITVTAVGGGQTVNATFDLVVMDVSRVFITSTKYNGNLGGLAGADSKCQARADAASLGGTWKAWLSTTSVSSASRLVNSSSPYVNLDGTVVAYNWADLTDSELVTYIKLTELNTASTPSYSGYSAVWSNTNANGSSNTEDCNGWTNGSSTSSYVGLANPTPSPGEWTRWTGVGCSNLTSLYCFEQ